MTADLTKAFIKTLLTILADVLVFKALLAFVVALGVSASSTLFVCIAVGLIVLGYTWMFDAIYNVVSVVVDSIYSTLGYGSVSV